MLPVPVTYGSPMQSNQNLSLHSNIGSLQGSLHQRSKLQSADVLTFLFNAMQIFTHHI
jgi:hypothetical protein